MEFAKETNVFAKVFAYFHARMQRLRLVDILLSLRAAVPSTLAMAILLCLRKPQWILHVYYEDPTRDFLHDLYTEYIPLMVFVLIYIGLAAAYLFIAKLVRKRSVAGIVVGGIIAIYINTGLSMEFGGMTEILLPIGTLWNIVVLIGHMSLVSRTIDLMYWWLMDSALAVHSLESETAEKRNRAILCSFCCLWVCWLPGLILCYPGSAQPDTIFQIESWLGLYTIDASHPILVTIFYGVTYSIGRALGGDMKGMFFALLMQATICSIAITYYAQYIRKITGSKGWQIATVLYFALVPTWQNAVEQLLKDVLHTGCFLLFYVWYLKALEDDGTGKRTFLHLFLGAFLISFTRKAAFYIAVIAIIVVAVKQRKHFLLKAAACLVGTILCFYIPNTLIFPLIGVEGERKGENYSMQFQQVAYYCKTYQDEMTQEEIDIINTTLDYDTIVRDFTPSSSDPVKVTFRDPEGDHSAFWSLYRQMFLKHPFTMLKAIYICTFEHLDPWLLYRFEFRTTSGPDVNVHSTSSADTMAAYWESWRNVPLVRMILVTGLSTWIVMALTGFAARRKSGRMMLGIIPAFVLFIGLFMSHVNGMLRYGYPLIAVSPLLLAWAVHTCQAVSDSSAAVSESPRKAVRLWKMRPSDRFEWYLNTGDSAGAKRMIVLYKVSLYCGGLIHGEAGTATRYKQIQTMRMRLSEAEHMADVAHRIQFYLDLWKDTEDDTPRNHLLSAIRTGSELIEEAERCRQLFPDAQLINMEALTQKVQAIREICARHL